MNNISIEEKVQQVVRGDRELTMDKVRNFIKQRAVAVIFKRRSLCPEPTHKQEYADENEFFMVEKIERSTDLTNHVTLRIIYRYFIDEFTDSEHLFQFIASWLDGTLKCLKPEDAEHIKKDEIVLQVDFEVDIKLLKYEFQNQISFQESHGFLLCSKIK